MVLYRRDYRDVRVECCLHHELACSNLCDRLKNLLTNQKVAVAAIVSGSLDNDNQDRCFLEAAACDTSEFPSSFQTWRDMARTKEKRYSWNRKH